MKQLLIPLSLLALLSACSSSTPPTPPLVRPVKVTQVVARNEINKVYAATVRATTFSTLAFSVSGQIIQLPVVEGEQVAAGALIAAIDPIDLQLTYSANKAAYETATLQLQRNQRLLEKEAISRQEFEISKATYQREKSAYEIAAKNLERSRLLAPFAGSIEHRYVENFQRIAAGEAVVELINTSQIEVATDLPDNSLPLLQLPQKRFQVEFENYPNRTFRAQLKEYLAASPNGSGIPVTLWVDDPQFSEIESFIKPGFACQVTLIAQLDSLLEEGMSWIPLTALFANDRTGQTAVWVVNNENRVTLQPVTVYAPSGRDHLFIERGLQVGERIVTAGVYQLTEGQRVKILEQE